MSMGFSLLSLAGMPPLTGFTSKFVMLIYLLYKNQFLMFFFFSVINIFMIYFYIQNIRFMMRKVSSQIILIKNFVANIEFNLVALLTFLNFLNLFNIFVFGDFFLIFNS
jgi:NADH:ubiquinone oxidoreductase subunit 2 (subunit N)